jgi:hypothetical protein
MTFELVDRYLLGEPVSKTEVVADVLAHRSTAPAAAPFYRALEAVGVRAADEAFVALRLVLAGATPSDERVRRLRALAALARASRNDDRTAIGKIFRRDAAVLGDLREVDRSGATLESAVRRAYFSEFER